jgi:parallel beta-helix repeat protein
MRKMLFVLCTLIGFAFGQPFQDGVAAYNSKDYDKAIRNFTEAIRLNPDASAYYNRGIAYMAKGDNARAIADLEAALRLSPNHDKAKSSLELVRQRQSVPAAKTATVDELDISIRDASDYLNEKIPKGSKIVILNIQSNSSDLSDYIIDELIANAVNDGFFTVVDRQQLDAIRAEQKFQLSGVVDDKDALAIGKLFGAKTIVSGAVSRLGATGYRIRIRALEVQTAQVQGQFNRNIAASATINSLMAGSGTASGGYATGTATATPAAQATTPANNPGATSTIQGTMVPGNNLTEKLAWLQRSADSHNTYIVEVSANENIAPHTLSYDGAINITIVLKGDKENRTIRLQSNGTMFTVRPNVTFVLENNITLRGHNGNNSTLVMVNGGTFRMNTGSTITGNNTGGSGAGGGVYVEGTFIMSGGTISGNTASNSGGGGVYVGSGTFTMSGGTISGNTAKWGGGVTVQLGTFTMTGGTIYSNSADAGGGVHVSSQPSNQTPHIFIMRSGTISNNTAREGGGGVDVHSRTTFTKTGGVITGYNSDQNNGNVVRDEAGNVIARRGHAVLVGNTRKETTAGPGVNLSNVNGNISGAWDQ